MADLHVEAEAEIAAPPEVVWALLADTESYAKWGIWDEATVDSEGADGLVGTIRRLKLGRTSTVERITQADAPRSMSYTVVSGMPVRNYLARVVLTPTEGGTHVHWHATWDRTLLGRIVQARLRALYPQIVELLAEAAVSEAKRASGVA